MLQENDELIFEDLPVFQEDKILEDLLAEYASVLQEDNGNNDASVLQEGKGNDDITSGSSDGAKKRKRRKSVIVSNHVIINEENKGTGSSAKDAKKVMHREVERQRRQEMAGLYASLRSLLPLEYIKGKRAVSDHMDEAVKFIKHMQAKTKAMRMQRDKIKKLFMLSDGVNDERSNISDSSYCVKVNLLGGEVEILISGGEGFPLSKVFLELQQKGLNVISSLSNRVNEQSLHKIQIQASNLTCDDISDLQQRLAYVIKQT